MKFGEEMNNVSELSLYLSASFCLSHSQKICVAPSLSLAQPQSCVSHKDNISSIFSLFPSFILILGRLIYVFIMRLFSNSFYYLLSLSS